MSLKQTDKSNLNNFNQESVSINSSADLPSSNFEIQYSAFDSESLQVCSDSLGRLEKDASAGIDRFKRESVDESNSDADSFYSLNTECSDVNAGYNKCCHTTPTESISSSGSFDYSIIQTPTKSKENYIAIENNDFISSDFSSLCMNNSVNLVKEAVQESKAKRILVPVSMDSKNGAIAKKEPSSKKIEETEKKKKGLKISFKRKKSSKSSSPNNAVDTEETSGADSDISYSSSNPASPTGTLDKNALKWNQGVPSVVGVPVGENKNTEETIVNAPELEHSKADEGNSKQVSKDKLEKPEKRFGSFKFLKKDSKKQKSDSISSLHSVSSTASESSQTKSHLTESSKIMAYEMTTANAAEASLNLNADSETKPVPSPPSLKLETLVVSNPSSTVTNVSTLDFGESDTGKMFHTNESFNLEDKENKTEIQVDASQAELKVSKVSKSPLKSFNFKSLKVDKEKESPKPPQAKSIAQEIEEVEKGTLSTSNDVEKLSNHSITKEAGATSDKREHLYKILVIGELGSGKTSIIKRYVHQFFSQHYRATIGVDFALKVINWDQHTIIRLQLWDIAGQERFGNMTRVYYKEAVGAFIVFDVTRSQTFDAVTKWKNDLDTKVTLPDGSSIPTVLLANKCDQPKEGVVCNPARMDDFCRERNFAGWFETSAKENINIDEASKFLISQILINEREGLMVNDSLDNDKFSIDRPEAIGESTSKSKCPC